MGGKGNNRDNTYTKSTVGTHRFGAEFAVSQEVEKVDVERQYVLDTTFNDEAERIVLGLLQAEDVGNAKHDVFHQLELKHWILKGGSICKVDGQNGGHSLSVIFEIRERLEGRLDLHDLVLVLAEQAQSRHAVLGVLRHVEIAHIFLGSQEVHEILSELS